jgi:hypothetical protein
MEVPRAILFDFDDTLVESFSPPVPHMVMRIERLLMHLPIAIVTGAAYMRIERDLLSAIRDTAHLSRLFIFTNSSSQCYLFKDGSWHNEYNLVLTSDEKSIIIKAIEETIEEMQYFRDMPYSGTRVIDRETQITYIAVGLDAPHERKITWDSDRSQRSRMCAVLAQKLPNFNVVIGGASSVDITRKGINKAYGVRWLSQHLNIPPSDMLFIGDGLIQGGNDASVIPTGIQTRLISGPAETAKIIDEFLGMLQ